MKKNIVVSLIAFNIIILSAISVSAHGMHLPGKSYLHKELSEERVIHVEESDSRAVTGAGQYKEVKHVNTDKEQLENNLNSEKTATDSVAKLGVIEDVTIKFPVAKTYITSMPGVRWGGWHAGIDTDLNNGDLIESSHAGKVIASGFEPKGLGGYGNVVLIEGEINGVKLRTLYAHMKSTPLVKTGASVKEGDKLGYTGATGNVTGVHLHFEVWVHDKNDAFLQKSYGPVGYASIKTKKPTWYTATGGIYEDGNWNKIHPADVLLEIDQSTPIQRLITRGQKAK